MDKKINYNKLRPDVLSRLVANRGIECKDNKTDMIRNLKLDDEGKYELDHTVEKYDKDKFLIGIVLSKDSKIIMSNLSKLMNKREAKLSHFACGRHYYISTINVLEETQEG